MRHIINMESGGELCVWCFRDVYRGLNELAVEHNEVQNGQRVGLRTSLETMGFLSNLVGRPKSLHFLPYEPLVRSNMKFLPQVVLC